MKNQEKGGGEGESEEVEREEREGREEEEGKEGKEEEGEEEEGAEVEEEEGEPMINFSKLEILYELMVFFCLFVCFLFCFVLIKFPFLFTFPRKIFCNLNNILINLPLFLELLPCYYIFLRLWTFENNF